LCLVVGISVCVIAC